MLRDVKLKENWYIIDGKGFERKMLSINSDIFARTDLDAWKKKQTSSTIAGSKANFSNPTPPCPVLESYQYTNMFG